MHKPLHEPIPQFIGKQPGSDKFRNMRTPRYRHAQSECGESAGSKQQSLQLRHAPYPRGSRSSHTVVRSRIATVATQQRVFRFYLSTALSIYLLFLLRNKPLHPHISRLPPASPSSKRMRATRPSSSAWLSKPPTLPPRPSRPCGCSGMTSASCHRQRCWSSVVSRRSAAICAAVSGTASTGLSARLACALPIITHCNVDVRVCA